MFAGFLKQSTAVTIKFGPLVDPGGDTTEAAASFAANLIRVAKNGGAFAAKNEATDPTLDAAGQYDVMLNATDTNGLGILSVMTYTGGGVRAHKQVYQVLPANVWDSLMAGSDTLDVQVTGIGANVVTASALATDAVGEIADGVWDEARAGHVAAGSFGEGVASVTGSVGSVATGGITSGSFAASAINAAAIASNAITAAKIASDAITAAKIAADVTTEIAAGLPTAAGIADAVWDEARAGHVAAGSFGEGVASVQGAVTGSVASVVGAVGSIAAGGITSSSFAAFAINAAAIASNAITASKIATDAISAAKIASDAGNKIADHVLRRPYGSARTSSDGDALSFRSLLGGLGKLVNKWSISGTTLTVFQEDDATSSAPGGTQTLTAAPGADPISAIDT